MPFSEEVAREIARNHCDDLGEEEGLVEAFTQVCCFLSDNPTSLSWSGKQKPSIHLAEGIEQLAKKYFAAYRTSDFPKKANTIPDQMVSVVMMKAFGYTEIESERIKVEHQRSMTAENCIGSLLERYLDSVLRPQDWCWCCGSFVRAVDFIKKNETAENRWLALQIKNRDNSENSSSTAIRDGTPIEKWFRSFSRTGKTNWNNLPPLMKGFNLSEEGFVNFVSVYLEKHKMEAPET